MEFEIARLLAHTRVLSETYPHRHAGEVQQQQAAAYIADELRAAGLDVELFKTPILGWEVARGPVLEVTGPERRVLECAPYIYSGSTPPSGFSGRLVRVGPMYAGRATPWNKYALVDARGDWQVIIVGVTDGPAMARRGTPAGSCITADGPSYSWPSCAIGADDVALLETWLETGKSVMLHYAIETKHKPNCISVNVRGTIPGRKTPGEAVAFGVHHDTVGALGFPTSVSSPGANDNASGVAVMIELARHFAAHGSDKTIWFFSFDGEERNLMGSSDMVRTLHELGQLDSLVAYVGVDQAAYGDNFAILASGADPHLQPPLDMKALARGVINRLDLRSRVGLDSPKPLHAASDHWPFYYAGVPSALTGWHPYPAYHRGDDTFDKCTDDDKFLTTAEVAYGLLNSVLDQPALGTARRAVSAGYVVTPPQGPSYSQGALAQGRRTGS